VDGGAFGRYAVTAFLVVVVVVVVVVYEEDEEEVEEEEEEEEERERWSIEGGMRYDRENGRSILSPVHSPQM
jgi:hypothetical protein